MNITMDALIKRINRRLAAKGEQLRRARGQRERAKLGDYYVLDVNRNFVTAQHVDPENVGRKMGALRKGETVSGEIG
jgi:hypothetical protein